MHWRRGMGYEKFEGPSRVTLHLCKAIKVVVRKGISECERSDFGAVNRKVGLVFVRYLYLPPNSQKTGPAFITIRTLLKIFSLTNAPSRAPVMSTMKNCSESVVTAMIILSDIEGRLIVLD